MKSRSGLYAILLWAAIWAALGTLGRQELPGQASSGLAATPQTGPVAMSLEVVPSDNVNCRPQEPVCFVEPGTQFTLSVNIDAVPASGYVSYQVDVVHTGITSKAIRHVASAEFPVEAPTSGTGTESFLAGALTASQPPQPVSTYTGPLVEADLDCPVFGAQSKIGIRVDGTVGTLVVDPNNDPIPITVGAQDIDADPEQDKVAGAIAVECVDRLTVDVDGDGCTGTRELSGNESQGGRRDPKNPWDYFNPSGDRHNRVDDILAVVHQVGVDNPPLTDPYDRTFLGPDPWDLGPPDGVIRVEDVIHIIKQFGHDCA